MSVLASKITKEKSEAHIFKEAALQTTGRFNLKPDLVIVNQGRVHEDGGNFEDGRRSMIDKYTLLLQVLGNLLQVIRGHLFPTVLGSRGAILKATTEG